MSENLSFMVPSLCIAQSLEILRLSTGIILHDASISAVHKHCIML